MNNEEGRQKTEESCLKNVSAFLRASSVDSVVNLKKLKRRRKTEESCLKKVSAFLRALSELRGKFKKTEDRRRKEKKNLA